VGAEQTAIGGDDITLMKQENIPSRQALGAHTADPPATENAAEGGVVGTHSGVGALGAVGKVGAQKGVPYGQKHADKPQGDPGEKQGYDPHRQEQPQSRLAESLPQAGAKGAGGRTKQGLGGAFLQTALGLLGGKSYGGVNGQVGEKLLHSSRGGINTSAMRAGRRWHGIASSYRIGEPAAEPHIQVT
jgi:hypothetical protein